MLAIRNKRRELGYTQAEVAAKLGIRQNTYSKIERNDIRFTVDIFLMICEILGMEPDELLSK